MKQMGHMRKDDVTLSVDIKSPERHFLSAGYDMAKHQEKNPMVSVIIPVYNAENYLRECLDSLLQQSFDDFEIICINDGSTDNSIHVLNSYASTDPRILILEQKNRGPGAARNRGMECANGKYLYFMDADDFIENSLLEKVVTKAEQYAAQIVLFDACFYNSKSKTVEYVQHILRPQLLPQQKVVFSAKECAEHLFQLCYPGPCTKLILRSYIEEQKLHFPNLYNAEDLVFIYECLSSASRVSVVPEVLYYYRVELEHNLENTKEDKNPAAAIDAMLMLYTWLKQRNLYDMMKNSWQKEFWAQTIYILKTTKTKVAYKKIYNRLMQEDVKTTGVFNPQESQDYNYHLVSKFLASPIKYRLKSESRFSAVFDHAPSQPPLVSIIIPVYNATGTIEECITSVTVQSFNQYEIICVDDGSTDDSLNKLLSFAHNTPCIRVFFQENSGPSVARNNAIDVAKGKYIIFLDSDDKLTLESLEKLIFFAESKHADVILYQASLFYEKNYSGSYTEDPDYYVYSNSYPMVYVGKELFSSLIANNDYNSSAIVRMVRKSFLQTSNIHFYEGIYHGDELWTFQIMLQAERIAVLPEFLLLRRIRNESIMTQERGVGHLIGVYTAYCEAIKIAASMPLSVEQNEAVQVFLLHLLRHIEDRIKTMTEEELHWFDVLCTPEQRFLAETMLKSYINANVKGQNMSVTDKQIGMRLNDHDIALHNAQEELSASRQRLDDHDKALANAQEELSGARQRLDDHDKALANAQEELSASRQRLDDHDRALANAQKEIAEIREVLNNRVEVKIKRYLRGE